MKFYRKVISDEDMLKYYSIMATEILNSLACNDDCCNCENEPICSALIKYKHELKDLGRGGLNEWF